MFIQGSFARGVYFCPGVLKAGARSDEKIANFY